jgi:hypothetical protein
MNGKKFINYLESKQWVKCIILDQLREKTSCAPEEWHARAIISYLVKKKIISPWMGRQLAQDII